MNSVSWVHCADEANGVKAKPSVHSSWTVRERITKEHLTIIRQLIGESTNLNQLAKQANTYGFLAVSEECQSMAKTITQLINRLKDDR
ncbi:MobC family plasmid mobilization relaxosome protein [Bacteroides thetaiotaomicron]|nr:MobC family plasmid mobilization relaxosome protein [Bacteroides thetaiotaomicron]MCS2876664.1 MobC family plasmid mobilization relaxosome protein [Bacteroides thetaiotaomicron]